MKQQLSPGQRHSQKFQNKNVQLIHQTSASVFQLTTGRHCISPATWRRSGGQREYPGRGSNAGWVCWGDRYSVSYGLVFAQRMRTATARCPSPGPPGTPGHPDERGTNKPLWSHNHSCIFQTYKLTKYKTRPESTSASPHLPHLTPAGTQWTGSQRQSAVWLCCGPAPGWHTAYCWVCRRTEASVQT